MRFCGFKFKIKSSRGTIICLHTKLICHAKAGYSNCWRLSINLNAERRVARTKNWEALLEMKIENWPWNNQKSRREFRIFTTHHYDWAGNYETSARPSHAQLTCTSWMETIRGNRKSKLCYHFRFDIFSAIFSQSEGPYRSFSSS